MIFKQLQSLLLRLHVHSVNYIAKLAPTRRAHSSHTIINSLKEPVLGRACNPPDPH